MGTRKLFMLLVLAMAVIVLTAGSVSAKVIFSESFEEPDLNVTSTRDAGTWKISGFNNDGNSWPGWTGANKYTGILNKSVNTEGSEMFINQFGNQVVYIFNNIPSGYTDARLTTLPDSLDTTIEADTTYTLKFNTASTSGIAIDYHVELLAIADDNTETILATAYGPIASNDLAANPVSLVYKSDDEPANLDERIAIRLRKGQGDYHYNVYYDNIKLSADKLHVSPYDGELVAAGDVDLSWTNMDPCTPGSVYVDVLFGTEPNEPDYNMVKVLTGAADTTLVTVPTTPNQTYYWQIISYTNGDPVTNPSESDIFSFTTSSDIPPESVDILTPDMVTWSGEPIDLTSNVVDDGESPLTYSWTSIPTDGVEFSATDVANPTITITKPVGLSVLPIANFGFEEPRDAGDGNGFVPYPDGDSDQIGHLKAYTWTLPNWGYYFNGYCGVLNPTSDAYIDEAPEGENVGFVASISDGNPAGGGDPYYTPAGGLSINTISELKPNTEYTLSVKVGNPLYNDAFPGYRVQLIAGGAVLVQDANSLAIEPGTFITSELSYTSGETVTAGRMLGIRLFTLAGVTEVPGGSNTYEVHFDDVKLLSNGDSTYVITVAVNDESSLTTVDDSMTIDVFDTPCQAGIIGMGIIGLGDVNGDCDVNSVDLQEMATTWLNDHALLEIIATPGGDNGNPVDPNAQGTAIDAGADMLIWSGEPLALDGTIVNDANVPQWSADTASLENSNLTITITDGDKEDATVEITKTDPTGDATSVTMTLAVSGVEDTMIIEVYDDACTAAVGIDPLALDAADFNSDCITNLQDLATLASKWLTRSTITEPGIKPQP